MRTALRALVALCLLAPPALTSTTVAHATTVAPLTVEQMTDAATYIVEGRVVRVWTEMDAEGKVWTRAEIAVSETFKGPDAPGTLIVDSLGGFYEDRSLLVDGMARFSPEEDVFLFLDAIKGGARLTPISAHRGKFTIKRPPHESRRIAVSYDVNPLTRFDARFLPVPPREEWLYVDELEGVVSSRLVHGWDGREIPGISAEKLRVVNQPERRIR